MSAQLKQVSPSVPTAPVSPMAPESLRAPGGLNAVRRGLAGRRARIIVPVAAVVVALGGVVAARILSHATGPASPMPSQTVTVGTVAVGAIDRTLVVDGSLAAWDELPIGNEAGGLAIVEIAVEEGDTVSKGQLLARLDDRVLRAELAQAEASIAQSEAGLLKAEATAAAADSDAGRARALIKNGFISGQVAEQRATALATARADVNVARQNLATARALRDERAAQLAQTEIRAPTSGIVSRRTATLGNVVPVGQQLFRLIRDSRIELRAEIPELELSSLRSGQTATVTLDGAGGAFEGRIRLVGATVDPQTRIGLVYIALPTDPALKPGMFVHGSVKTGTDSVAQVPAEAVVFKDGKPAVFVVGADDRARLRMVEAGARLDGRIEIAGGVAAGERVALAGAGYLKDNDLVRIEPAISGPEAAR